MNACPDFTTLLVDGYNIIGAWPRLLRIRDRHGLAAARDQLTESLTNYSAVQGYQTQLIFDAQYRQGQGSRELVTDLLQVCYTESGQTADTHIELFCAQACRAAVRVIVATSDRTQKHMVIGYGADWISAQRLVTDLEAIPAFIQNSQKLTKQRPGRLLAHTLDPDAKQRLEKLRFGIDP
jgi:hypothetical protein